MSASRQTRQQAIDTNFKDCNYDELDVGTWRDQIERCPSRQCPFYEFRPLTTATMKLRQEAKIEAMTPGQLRSYREKQESARIQLSTGRKQQEIDFPERVTDAQFESG